jgi:S1-C subfamily serine protease
MVALLTGLRRRPFIPIALFCLVIQAVPASAQHLLKQMQDEIAGIVKATRSAVVTIEDRPATTVVNSVPVQLDTVGKPLNTQYTKESLALGIKPANTDKLRAPVVTTSPKQVGRVASINKDAREYKYTAANQLNSKIDTAAAQNAKAGVMDAYATLSFVAAPKSGTGFCIGDGYVVSTADVLEGMKNPVVILDNGTRVNATLVGTMKEMNIGLLRLSAQVDVPTLKLGDSGTVAVGHFAISIGNQSGQENSVALNLIGGLRSGTYAGGHFYPSLLQIAGTVGAGTSGAPLVSADGEVIGVMVAIPADDLSLVQFTQEPVRTNLNVPSVKPDNTLNWSYKPNSSKPAPPSKKGKATTKAGNVTLDDSSLKASNYTRFLTVPQANWQIEAPKTNEPYFATLQSPVSSAGFAVPINDLKPVIESLRTGHTIETVWLGVELSENITESIKDGVTLARPLVTIDGVYANSPAQRAGVKPGDQLVSIGSTPIKNSADVHGLVVRMRPGDRATLVLYRDKSVHTVEVPIEKRPTEIKQEPVRLQVAPTVKK